MRGTPARIEGTASPLLAHSETALFVARTKRNAPLFASLPKHHHEQFVEVHVTPTQGQRLIDSQAGIEEQTHRRIHKRVHHFLMVAVGGELSDADIEVSEVAWVPLEELDGRLAYAGERRLARRATELLADSA